ncbi:probable protein phosphatase 2C 33 isoform X1 [Cryptomeria japonica]|uniref:probable protein phosphatase 2C 33 isoform X1 n=1 Tax=Cryptomeria japonica TaxID=3369 RepID=UPI0025AD1A32|nr:probable protein phosphatase 2C 33 isoform X1 [Cryptomeria japonica]
MGSCLSTDGSSFNALPRSASSSSARMRSRKNKRKTTSQTNQAKLDEHVSKIPGRMFSNGSSSVACMFTQQGRKGTNQDAMLVWEDFCSRKDTVFCGVFDGHGPFGHLVAKRVRDSLPSKLWSQWETEGRDDSSLKEVNVTVGSINSEDSTMDDEWRELADAEEREKGPEIFSTLKELFLKAFKVMDKELRLHPTIDCFCSGTTAVTLVKQGQDLVIGNVGDSRAVLGTRDQDNSLAAVQLTVDLKPNLPREAERIRQCKGRVFALHDEPEVARVWLPNNDSPGLAMARAFGDFCLKDFGLIAVPDVSYHCLTERDEFVVLATDGIWDVLSNKEVVDIVASAPSRTTAAKALVDYAVRAWHWKYPTSKVDDCAVICLFLDNSLPSESKSTTVQGQDTGIQQVPKEVISLQEVSQERSEKKDESVVDGQANGPSLGRLNTLRTGNELCDASQKLQKEDNSSELNCPDRNPSKRSLAECISTAEDEEYSALEGVTRVNSLLNLPRFLTGDKKAGGLRKWF